MAVALSSRSVADQSQQPARPEPMNTTPPPLQQSHAVAVCVDCDAPFDTATHKKVLKGLVSNPYVAQLRSALFVQDKIHQFESKAHFDNCDFEGAIAYIDSLLAEVDQLAKDAEKVRGNEVVLRTAVEKVFYSLGQALHAVQDFYAHTNYVELKVQSVKRATDLPLVRVWQPGARDEIKALQEQGLVSGYVFWGFPQICKGHEPSHSELAKDSPTTTSGKIRVPRLRNESQYEIAVFLAREASVTMLRDAFRKWPLIKEANGNDVAFEVLVDNRGL